MYYFVNFICATCTISVVVFFQYTLKDCVFDLYTQQDAIKEVLNKVWPMFLAYQLFETIQDQGSAVVKGTGQQGIGLFFTTVAYFLIAMPICY